MYLIRSNYSNNSLALIQWAYENNLKDVTVVYIDTGWSAEGWLDYVSECEAYVTSLGFTVQHLKSRMTFDELVGVKNGFPTARSQWCSLHLKGISLLTWLEGIDPDEQATVLIAKRREEHGALPEILECCEYHGDRKVWHPLVECTDEMRDQLISRSGFDKLSGPSQECAPCINSRISDIQHLSESDIEKTEELEEDVEAPFFNPELCGGHSGIHAIVKWAVDESDDALNPKFGCSFAFGCGV